MTWLWWVLLILGLTALIVGLASAWRANERGAVPDAYSARRVLDERFARGEIEEDEYRARRDQLDER